MFSHYLVVKSLVLKNFRLSIGLGKHFVTLAVADIVWMHFERDKEQEYAFSSLMVMFLPSVCVTSVAGNSRSCRFCNMSCVGVSGGSLQMMISSSLSGLNNSIAY